MSNIPEQIHYNFRLMLEELLNRGIVLRYIGNTDVVEASYNGHLEIIVNSDNRLTPYNYIHILADKALTKKFLEDKGFSVPAGQSFASTDHDVALFYALNELKLPAVIKPLSGYGGTNVFANLDNREDFIIAFRELAAKGENSILVEKQVEGDDYRFFTTLNNFKAVVRRTPPTVVGDGKSTIQELIDAENYRRLNPRKTCLCQIWINDLEGIRTLNRAGYNYKDILPAGKILQLRQHSNVSYGGMCEDVTEHVHPSYYALASQVLNLFPGLGYAGIDILIKDIAKPANRENYSIIEINFRGGFSLHTAPGKGTPRNVLKPIVDLLFPETKK